MSRLACVVYLSSYEGEVARIEERLRRQGYNVRSFEVTKEQATAVKQGDRLSLPAQLRGCLADAELCVLLLDQDAACLGGIGGLGSDMGCRIVTLGGEPADVPADLDDIADGHLSDLNHPEADNILGGKPLRIKLDGAPTEERKPSRVKCQ